MNPHWQAVLWDLDGTLVDTAPDLGGAVQDLCRQQGVPSPTLAQLRPLASRGAPGLLSYAFDLRPEHPRYAPLREAFLALYRDRRHGQSNLFPGIAGCLAGLAAAQIPWGIVTNKALALSEDLLATISLPNSPAVLVAGDSSPRQKPDPLPVQMALAKLGDPDPSAVLFLGDDHRDILAAHGAGCVAWAAAWGYGLEPESWGADRIIPRSDALSGLLGLGTLTQKLQH